MSFWVEKEVITDAKRTRLACDSAVERFENIVEGPSLWHAKQSFRLVENFTRVSFGFITLHCSQPPKKKVALQNVQYF